MKKLKIKDHKLEGSHVFRILKSKVRGVPSLVELYDIDFKLIDTLEIYRETKDKVYAKFIDYSAYEPVYHKTKGRLKK